MSHAVVQRFRGWSHKERKHSRGRVGTWKRCGRGQRSRKRGKEGETERRKKSIMKMDVRHAERGRDA